MYCRDECSAYVDRRPPQPLIVLNIAEVKALCKIKKKKKQEAASAAAERRLILAFSPVIFPLRCLANWATARAPAKSCSAEVS